MYRHIVELKSDSTMALRGIAHQTQPIDPIYSLELLLGRPLTPPLVACQSQEPANILPPKTLIETSGADTVGNEGQDGTQSDATGRCTAPSPAIQSVFFPRSVYIEPLGSSFPLSLLRTSYSVARLQRPVCRSSACRATDTDAF